MQGDSLSLESLNQETDCSNNYGEICFENNLLATVAVFLCVKGSISDIVSLILPKAAEDCSYQIPMNIYEYQILHKSISASVRKGQLKVERCDNLEIVIK